MPHYPNYGSGYNWFSENNVKLTISRKTYWLIAGIGGIAGIDPEDVT
ncbi:MAG: hypothetical protein HWQ38_38360 [Nostoc sp. NMS7]|nr:hypothetical protein [Nostoc sp. NMS7]